LSGTQTTGWEPVREAVGRFIGAIRTLTDGDVLAVTHGVVMTLWLQTVVANVDATTFWEQLTMPDAWCVDLDQGTLNRLA